jgi:cytochrome c nitrite reductase small subunit
LKRSVKVGFWSIGALLLVVAATPPILSATPAEPAYLCASCHTMEPWHESYLADSHGGAITCSACHTPHGLKGLAFKYGDGARHVVAQVLGAKPEEIRISSQGLEIVLNNCASCHTDSAHAQQPDVKYCINCHAEIPHG